MVYTPKNTIVIRSASLQMYSVATLITPQCCNVVKLKNPYISTFPKTPYISTYN